MESKEESSFRSGQVLKTDRDIELAIVEKVLIVAYQDGMRLRPPAPIVSYSEKLVTMADGITLLRSRNLIRTLDDSEILKFIFK